MRFSNEPVSVKGVVTVRVLSGGGGGEPWVWFPPKIKICRLNFCEGTLS